MKTRKVDVVVIGAGTAGLNAVAELRKAESDWLLVEAGPLGTTCARVGCMPSKLLIAAGDRAQAVRDAAQFGIGVEGMTVDAKAVFKRLRSHRDRFVEGVVNGMDKLPDERKVMGTARFTAPSTLRIDRERGAPLQVEAHAVVIATGARPAVPPVLQNLGSKAWLSDEVFELEQLPASLAVIGTGSIGLELGQALQRLGVKVSFFSNEAEIGPLRDPEVQDCVQQTLRADHDFHMQVRIDEAEQGADGGIRLSWLDREDKRQSREFERVLLATGRVPRLGGLDLEQTGITLDRHGMPKGWNPCTRQCDFAPVFLAGDVSNHRPFLHEAADDGRIAGLNAARFPEVSGSPRRARLSIVFCHPQMAAVGALFEDLDEGDYASGGVSFENQGRARIIGSNQGLARLYAERGSCKLMGAELFGPGVEHLAHLLAWAVQQELIWVRRQNTAICQMTIWQTHTMKIQM